MGSGNQRDKEHYQMQLKGSGRLSLAIGVISDFTKSTVSGVGGQNLDCGELK